MKTLSRRIPLIVALASLGLTACVGAGEDDIEPQDPAAASSPVAAQERYIVKLNDFSQRAAVLQAAGATVARELPGHDAVAAYIPAAAVQGVERNPHVDYVEVDPERYPTAQTTPYGISMVQATDPAFSNASGSVKVCVIDSGLYTGHEDLQGLPITGEPGTAWDQDGCGHGTHVAGTIAAVNDTGGVVGVAPDSVSLHIVRVFGDDCSWSYASNLIAALDECRQAGAKVVSMSLGGGMKSNAENTAFASAYSAGVLSIAAAGNGGNTQTSYPAGYASVVSVAAIDSTRALASFSQRNADVEIAAPGVGVLSTVPWSSPSLTADGASYVAGAMEGSAARTDTGQLVDGGRCAAAGAWAGKVVLCERGDITFWDKVVNVQNGGGVAAVIYNNVSGGFSGTLGPGNSSSVPALSLSQEDGQLLVANKLGLSGTASSTSVKPGTGYEAWDGTSMATPHVSGVAALVWSFNPSWTNDQIRTALNATAEDLGAAGRDSSFGYGLVRARAALDHLNGGGGCSSAESSCSDGVDNDCDGAVDGADSDCVLACSPKGSSCTSGAQCCSGNCSGKAGARTCK